MNIIYVLIDADLLFICESYVSRFCSSNTCIQLEIQIMIYNDLNCDDHHGMILNKNLLLLFSSQEEERIL